MGPISLYTFLICSKVFSCLLLGVEDDGRLEGVRVAPHALTFHHLLFVDDSNTSESGRKDWIPFQKYP